MRLRDGESNLLAGLIKDEERKTQEGFPGINDIPILRSIFGNQDSIHDQSDLVMIVTPHIVRSREITTADLKPFYIGTGQNFGAGSAPSLISPDAPPAPPTVGAGQPTTAPGQPAPPPPAAGAPPAGLTGQPTQPPAGAQPPPAGTNKPNVVPIQPVENVPAPSALPPAQVILTTPGTEFQVGGGPYSVPLRITNVSQLGTITMTVTYDPKLLRASQVNQGSFMQGGGVTPTFAPKIDAATGRIDIVISRGADRTGATGTGLLAAVVFDAIAPGQTKIAVTATALTATGQSIAVQTQGSTVTIK